MNKVIPIVIVIVLIISGIAGYYFVVREDEDDDLKHKTCGPNPYFSYAEIIFNNATNNIEIALGPFEDANAIPINNVNVSITINNTAFYNFTNTNGYTTIHIPFDLIPKEEFNTTRLITCRKAGYDDLEFEIDFIYS